MTRTLQFDGLSRTPAPIKSAILFDALTRDYRDVLHGIDVLMLVCAGVDEKRETVAALVPDARFERFENSSHRPIIEESERFNRVLGRFVASLWSRPGIHVTAFTR